MSDCLSLSSKTSCKEQTIVDTKSAITSSNTLNTELLQDSTLVLTFLTQIQAINASIVAKNIVDAQTAFDSLVISLSLINGTSGQIGTNFETLIAKSKVVTCDLTSCGLTNSCVQSPPTTVVFPPEPKKVIKRAYKTYKKSYEPTRKSCF